MEQSRLVLRRERRNCTVPRWPCGARGKKRGRTLYSVRLVYNRPAVPPNRSNRLKYEIPREISRCLLASRSRSTTDQRFSRSHLLTPPSCILIRLSRRRLSRRRRLVVVRPHGQPLKDGKHLCHVRAHEIGSRPKLEGIAPITAVCVREPSARRMLLALPKAAVPKALERLKHVLETALLRVVEPPIAAPNEFEFEHRHAPTREQCTRALEHESVLSFRVHAEQVDRLPWPQLRGRKGVERRACDLPVEARPSASVESKAIGINSKVIRGIQKVHSGQQRQSEAIKGTQRCPVALNLRWIEEEALGGLHSEASESSSLVGTTSLPAG